MPKRPDTLETVLLVLEVLQRIPRNHKISASELQEQLTGAGITRDLRTIQRQLEMLCRHFDIECDNRNKPYGYRWKEQAKGLSVPMLTAQESLLLLLAQQHLRNLLPASLMKSFDGFFAQARSNLAPHTNARREREWLSKVRVVSTTQPLLPPKVNPGVFEEVSNALYGNRWLKVNYRNAAGKRSGAEVMPLGLAQQGPRLYLVCRYRGFNGERSLALHRIVSAQASTLTFERPKDFDLQRFDDEGRFGFGDGRRIRLSFHIDKEAGLHLLESPLSADQQVKKLNGEFRISATVVETAQLKWWLQGFGDQVSHVHRKALATIPTGK
jgi:predicted DNA-binding transcriptional regulator YafY